MKFSSDRHIYDESKLQKFCGECRTQSKKIVLATGGFDLLHPGHLRFLEKSRECGDILVVGINDDNYIRKTKGDNRPVQNQYDRAYLIAGLKCVNCVHIIGKNLIKIVRPDIFVMSTTSMQKPAERKAHYELIRKYGGTVVVFDSFSTTHSSELIESIRNSDTPCDDREHQI